MEYLHAYWRMSYIEAPKNNSSGENNPFKYLKNSDNDKSSLIVKRTDYSFSVLNKFPYNAGHMLVLPYREVKSLEDLDIDERQDFWNLVLETKLLLKKVLKPDGFNMGINEGISAGAGIPNHIHFHIVPRWTGDTNFMPVLGQTKVLPQALESLWERLKNA